jgi:hypothetical protein
MCGAEFFRQRPNFLIDGAEKFVQELATLEGAKVCQLEQHWHPPPPHAYLQNRPLDDSALDATHPRLVSCFISIQ